MQESQDPAASLRASSFHAHTTSSAFFFQRPFLLTISSAFIPLSNCNSLFSVMRPDNAQEDCTRHLESCVCTCSSSRPACQTDTFPPTEIFVPVRIVLCFAPSSFPQVVVSTINFFLWPKGESSFHAQTYSHTSSEPKGCWVISTSLLPTELASTATLCIVQYYSSIHITMEKMSKAICHSQKIDEPIILTLSDIILLQIWFCCGPCGCRRQRDAQALIGKFFGRILLVCRLDSHT